MDKLSWHHTILSRKTLKKCVLVLTAFTLSACDQTPEEDCKEQSCNISFSGDAWIGQHDALIYPNTKQNNIQLITFNNADCDIENLGTCQNAQSQTINGNNKLTVDALTLEKKGYFKLQNQSTFTSTFELSTQSIDINSRYNIASFNDIVQFKGKLWALERFDTPQSPVNPTTQIIWSSEDGLNWQKNQITQALPNMQHKMLVFNEQLWLIASIHPKGYRILSSTDGKEWTERNPSSEFNDVFGFEFSVFKNKLWAVGTRRKTIKKEIPVPNGGSYTSSVDVFSSYVWSSEDGETWAKEAENINPFNGTLLEHRLTTFNDELWLTGSQHKFPQEVGNPYPSKPTFESNVIWHSKNGKIWKAVSTPSIKPRAGHQTIVFNNKIWLIGGFIPSIQKSERSNEVWSSENGLDWTKVAEGPFSPRSMHRAFVFNNHLWISGDGRSFGSGKNDIWRTEDGINWRLGVNLSAAKKVSN